MVYTGRLVVIGKTGSAPFAGFVLASTTLPYRRMELRNGNPDEKKIHTFPLEGHEADNIKFPDVDNYSCVIAKKIPLPRDSYAIVSFNGHMCKRTMANIEDGMKPFLALDSTLFEFRGLPKDARVGGVVYVESGVEQAFLGINDADKGEKRVKRHVLEENTAIYTFVRDTSLDNIVRIPALADASELAKYIAKEMIPGIEKVIAAGVFILKDGEFETGIYNTPKEEIEVWARK